MLNYTDNQLNKITMYRLLLYYLIVLVVVAMGLSQLDYLHYRPLAIGFSAITLTVVCWVTNKLFAYGFDAPTNVESAYITALILALIIQPPTDGNGVVFLVVAGSLAMASKYVLAIHKKHLFNPAAIAVVLTAFGAKQAASWWVGTAVMLPFVVIGGLLLARKLRRVQMVLSFLISTLLATTVYTMLTHDTVTSNLHRTIFNSALFFLAFVMLTEPLTSPPTVKKQRWYGILAGLLFPPQVHILGVYSTPELVLVTSNVFSYIISPKTKLLPALRRKTRLAPDIFDFAFKPDRPLKYTAGQYMEWTLPHPKTDSRGNRRVFTLASSPTEPDVHIGVKFYENSSSFKKALLKVDEKTLISASQITGDFVLPKDPQQKIVFIAGGIGVTPFRSMIKYLLDTDEKRDITLLYSAQNAAELAYKDIFDAAHQQLGIKVSYVITDQTAPNNDPSIKLGRINSELIKQAVPDYQERLFYISGTHGMVHAIEAQLKDMGVSRQRIKQDFFAGYA